MLPFACSQPLASIGEGSIKFASILFRKLDNGQICLLCKHLADHSVVDLMTCLHSKQICPLSSFLKRIDANLIDPSPIDASGCEQAIETSLESRGSAWNSCYSILNLDRKYNDCNQEQNQQLPITVSNSNCRPRPSGS